MKIHRRLRTIGITAILLLVAASVANLFIFDYPIISSVHGQATCYQCVAKAGWWDCEGGHSDGGLICEVSGSQCLLTGICHLPS